LSADSLYALIASETLDNAIEPVAQSFEKCHSEPSLASRDFLTSLGLLEQNLFFALLHPITLYFRKRGPLIAGVSDRQSISHESGYIESQNKKNNQIGHFKVTGKSASRPIAQRSAIGFGALGGDLVILEFCTIILANVNDIFSFIGILIFIY
jgi:hypothetical protein